MGRRPIIGIIGGTGALGLGLAKRWAAAGYAVLLGSRSHEKAKAAARLLEPQNGGFAVQGMNYLAAAQAADIVVLAVPFPNHDSLLDEISDLVTGKVVVDAVVPLVPPKVSVVQVPTMGSAGVIAQARLGDRARVVSAFHNVSALKLQQPGPIDCDVLVFGNDPETRDIVIALVEALGTRGIDGGPIANSVAAEALTSILIGINRRYKVHGAGIRITGLGRASSA